MSLKSSVTEQGDKVSKATTDGGGFDLSFLNTTILTKFLEVLGACLILLAAYFIARWIKSRLVNLEALHEQQRTAINLLEKIVTGFIVVIGLTAALKTIGLDMSLLVSVGLLGLSYGLRDVITNYIAGILIFLKSPFKIGDIVKIKNFVGKVENMELQSTSLKTFDHRDVTIYNSDIMKQSIENYSRYPMRRMEINSHFGYGTDIEKAVKLCEKILINHPSVLKNPKHSIIFKKFSDTGIMVQLKFWVQMPCNMLAIRSNIAWEITQAFDEQTVYAPYVRGFEAGSDFSLNENRQSRIKQFYGNALFADLAQVAGAAQAVQNGETTAAGTPGAPGAPGTPGQPGQLVPELIDSDEPSTEDDL